MFISALGVFFYSLAGSLLSKNNQRYYSQGLGFIAKKDYQNAYYNFSSVEKGNDFYCPSKYRAALAAQNLFDKNSAVIMYKDIIHNCDDTLFDEIARYNLARLYFEQKEYQKAQNLFDVLAKSAKTEKYNIAANYFLGEILSASKPDKAQAHYLKYLKAVPDGKYAKESVAGVQKIDRPLSSESNYVLGLALYSAKRYAEAKKYFLLVPIEKSWFYLSMCARKLGDSEQAQDFIDMGLVDYSDNLSEEDMYAVIDYLAKFASDKKSGYLKTIDLLVPEGLKGGDYALFMYVEQLQSSEKIPYYKKIVDVYPDGKFASDAMWNILYSEYKKGNYKKVTELAEEHAKKYADTIVAPRVLFFAAKACEKMNQYSKAKSYYSRVLDKYADDYYAFRAKLLLEGRKTAWTIKGKREINKEHEKINFPINYCKVSAKDRPLLDLLMNVGDWGLLEDLLSDNEAVKSWVSYKQGNRAISIVQARDFISNLHQRPEFQDDIYKLAYPLYFVDEINESSSNYDLDPYVVIAIMKEESHFNTSAKSYVGAGGLMQVMPDTASFIASKYGISYSSALRHDINKNIELGCAYLDYALSQLSKKYLFAVAGYNGGHNAVRKWNETLNYSDYDEFVEEIPYSETQNYIRKVFKSYWNYVNIYGKYN